MDPAVIIVAAFLAAQVFSPGPLSSAHKQLDGLTSCTKCHEEGGKHSNARCIECHKEIGRRIDEGVGYHARNKNQLCAECHKEGKFPRREWVRITEPELNPFLIAPLAKSAGGSQRCGRAVFASKADPDYQAILAVFRPIQEMLAKRPRMEMPGAQPAADVCRTCK